MVEQRQQKIARHFAILGTPIFGEVRDGGIVSYDPLTGEDHRTTAGLEQQLLFVSQEAMPTGLKAPVQLERPAIGSGLRLGVDGNLELFIAEDVEGLLADEFEALSPVVEFLADKPFDAADVIDGPGSGSLAVDEAGPVRDGVETEKGLTLLVGKLISRDSPRAEAIPGMPTPPCPGGRNLEPVGR